MGNKKVENTLREFARGKGIDLMGFSEMGSDQLYLRSENRAFLQEQGYRWAISVAARISVSASELLLRQGDPGLLFYFDKHVRERAAVLERAAYDLCLSIEDMGYRAFLVTGLGTGYSDGGPKVILSHITQAHLAGLGEMGDSGMLITPEYGPRVRLATILTSLPLSGPEELPKGICTHCGRCRKICPSGSIYGGRFDLTHPERAYRDLDKCTAYRDNNLKTLGSRFCNLCQVICPVGK